MAAGGCGRRSAPGIFLLALLVVTLAMARPAGAGTFVVTNTADIGPGSLRQAIHDANGNPGPDTITFDPATDGIPIVLAGPAGENGNASGDLDILDAGDLTIQGNGVANTIIDGGGIDRVFHVCPAGGCVNTVTFSALTIQNGDMVLGGGGIRHEAGTTVVDGSALRANRAVNGGGISNFAALVIQNNSVIGTAGGSNQAAAGNGGGVYNFVGTLTIDHSTVSTNTAYNNGGGIWNQATLNVGNGATIGGAGAGNTAGADGGGIYNYDGGVVTVDGGIVSSNVAIGNSESTGDGGGIYNKATLIVQNGGTIGGVGAGNMAGGDGGGIYNYDGGMVTVDGGTVSDNVAGDEAATTGNGGGIHNAEGGEMMVDGSAVRGNTAGHCGGGIRNFGTLNVQNGSTIGGAGAGNEASIGGGIYNVGVATVDASAVSANHASSGGGIWNMDTLNVQNGSTIGGAGAGNTAEVQGGGIYNVLGATTVDGSTVSANSAQRGGGIFNVLATMTMGGSTVSFNTASDDGGGIYNDGAGTTTVTGSRILHNTASYEGGGLFNDNDTAGATDVTGSCIVGNSAYSFYNNQPAGQIATGNWWGAPAGPNTPGADTVFGNVDVMHHLSDPILNCEGLSSYLPLVLR
jgi:hypothetical protein